MKKMTPARIMDARFAAARTELRDAGHPVPTMALLRKHFLVEGRTRPLRLGPAPARKKRPSYEPHPGRHNNTMRDRTLGGKDRIRLRRLGSRVGRGLPPRRPSLANIGPSVTERIRVGRKIMDRFRRMMGR